MHRADSQASLMVMMQVVSFVVKILWKYTFVYFLFFNLLWGIAIKITSAEIAKTVLKFFVLLSYRMSFSKRQFLVKLR